jgi:hypothetical protein
MIPVNARLDHPVWHWLVENLLGEKERLQRQLVQVQVQVVTPLKEYPHPEETPLHVAGLDETKIRVRSHGHRQRNRVMPSSLPALQESLCLPTCATGLKY